MNFIVLLLILGLSLPTYSVTLCNNVNTGYTIANYQDIDSCIYGIDNTQIYAVTAEHNVLKLNTDTGKYVYTPITELRVGDIIQDIIGITSIKDITTTIIEKPYVSLGQAFNKNTYMINSFSPFSINQFLRWVSVETSTLVEIEKPIVESSYIDNNCIINYDIPRVENNNIERSLGVFNPENVQYVGPIRCKDKDYEFYYYNPSLLVQQLSLDGPFNDIDVMSLNQYFNAISYALGQTDGVFYDGINVIYGYKLNTAACDALTITTESGYLIVNGLVLS